MRFTIHYMFTDMESDYADSGFDRNGISEEGYTFTEAVGKVIGQADIICHSEATMIVNGERDLEGGQSFTVIVQDDSSRHYWSLCRI